MMVESPERAGAGVRGRRAGMAQRAAVGISLLAGLLLALFAVPARAAPGWQAPVDISAADQHGHQPQVAVDRQGNAVAVWQSSTRVGWVVQGAVRPVGGAWQTPVDLSAAARYTAFHPQVAVNPQGDAIAVWSNWHGFDSLAEGRIAQGAVRPAGGAWQPAVDLSAPGLDASGQQVAIDAQGNAIAVWDRGYKETIVQAAVRPVGGAWQAPRRSLRRRPVRLDPAGRGRCAGRCRGGLARAVRRLL